MGNVIRNDAWQYTLAMLAQPSLADFANARAFSVPCRHQARRSHASRPHHHASAAHMEIVERHSESLLSVCWCDATLGRYGAQLWKLTKARCRAVCALSGAPIRRGDAVYRPWARGHAPANADWVVLASMVCAHEAI
ncbi:DUF3331 domain-containing protein [Paraburkholderia heleia]|uniref:DUF3331 domain-containing protein n=2 Tax=Paraburkholderia heleia TaxID=634127 RepID=UPI0009FBCDDE